MKNSKSKINKIEAITIAAIMVVSIFGAIVPTASAANTVAQVSITALTETTTQPSGIFPPTANTPDTAETNAAAATGEAAIVENSILGTHILSAAALPGATPDGADAHGYYTGFFLIDTNEDGDVADANDRVYFSIVDTDGDGLANFDTMDLSIGDQTFGEGAADDNALTAAGDDDVMLNGETVDIGAGALAFTVAIAAVPGDHITNTAAGEICYTLVRVGSDDIQETALFAAAGAGDVLVTAGPDGILQSVANDWDGDGFADAYDDEVVGTDIIEPAAGGDGRATTLARLASDDVQAIALYAVAGAGLDIITPGVDTVLDSTANDIDGDGVADLTDDALNAVASNAGLTSDSLWEVAIPFDSDGVETTVQAGALNLLLVDTDSDGIYESLDISITDADYGEGGLADTIVVDTNDERITTATNLDISDDAESFAVTFSIAPTSTTDDISITSRTYWTGSLVWGGSSHMVVLIDDDSNGAYQMATDIIAIDADGDGSVTGDAATEEVTGNSASSDQANPSVDMDVTISGVDVSIGDIDIDTAGDEFIATVPVLNALTVYDIHIRDEVFQADSATNTVPIALSDQDIVTIPDKSCVLSDLDGSGAGIVFTGAILGVKPIAGTVPTDTNFDGDNADTWLVADGGDAAVQDYITLDWDEAGAGDVDPGSEDLNVLLFGQAFAGTMVIEVAPARDLQLTVSATPDLRNLVQSTISVNAKDSTGTALAAADVDLVMDDGDGEYELGVDTVIQSQTTDENGDTGFLLTPNAAGEYYVVVSGDNAGIGTLVAPEVDTMLDYEDFETITADPAPLTLTLSSSTLETGLPFAKDITVTVEDENGVLVATGDDDSIDITLTGAQVVTANVAKTAATSVAESPPAAEQDTVNDNTGGPAGGYIDEDDPAGTPDTAGISILDEDTANVAGTLVLDNVATQTSGSVTLTVQRDTNVDGVADYEGTATIISGTADALNIGFTTGGADGKLAAAVAEDIIVTYLDVDGNPVDAGNIEEVTVTLTGNGTQFSDGTTDNRLTLSYTEDGTNADGDGNDGEHTFVPGAAGITAEQAGNIDVTVVATMVGGGTETRSITVPVTGYNVELDLTSINFGETAAVNAAVTSFAGAARNNAQIELELLDVTTGNPLADAFGVDQDDDDIIQEDERNVDAILLDGTTSFMRVDTNGNGVYGEGVDNDETIAINNGLYPSYPIYFNKVGHVRYTVTDPAGPTVMAILLRGTTVLGGDVYTITSSPTSLLAGISEAELNINVLDASSENVTNAEVTLTAITTALTIAATDTVAPANDEKIINANANLDDVAGNEAYQFTDVMVDIEGQFEIMGTTDLGTKIGTKTVDVLEPTLSVNESLLDEGLANVINVSVIDPRDGTLVDTDPDTLDIAIETSNMSAYVTFESGANVVEIDLDDGEVLELLNIPGWQVLSIEPHTVVAGRTGQIIFSTASDGADAAGADMDVNDVATAVANADDTIADAGTYVEIGRIDVAKPSSVVNPETIAIGSVNVPVSVALSDTQGNALPDRSVSLVQGVTTLAAGTTDTNGFIQLLVSPTGTGVIDVNVVGDQYKYDTAGAEDSILDDINEVITPTLTVGTIDVSALLNPLSVTASPDIVTVGTPELVTITATSGGSLVEGVGLTLSGCGVTDFGDTGADGTATFTVNATSAGAIDVTASLAGYETATTTITAEVEPVTCPGDFTEDGFVNVDDVVYMVTNLWGAGTEGDFTGDGFVNVDDVVYMVTNLWGACP